MRYPRRGGLSALLAVFVIGCGGDSEGPMEPMEPEIVTDPPPPLIQVDTQLGQGATFCVLFPPSHEMSREVGRRPLSRS